MTFRHGDKVKIAHRSTDEAWELYMDSYVGLHGLVTDPDSSINNPDDLVEVSITGKGTFRLPQDCLELLED